MLFALPPIPPVHFEHADISTIAFSVAADDE